MLVDHLNSQVLSTLPRPEHGQVLCFERRLPGFGVRLTKTKLTYIAEARVKGRTCRTTIGPTTVFTADEARKRAKQILGAMASGINVNEAEKIEKRERITLREAEAEFYKSRQLKPGTIAQYRRALRTYLGDWLSKELRQITPSMVVQRHRKLTEAHSPSSANLAMRTLRSIWNHARALTQLDTGEYAIPENPVNRLSATKSWHRLKRKQGILTDDRYPAFFDGLSMISEAAPHDENARAFSDIMDLLLRTGLRRNEAFLLKWENVSFSANTLTILQTKNGRDHVLPLTRQLKAMLSRRHQAQTPGQTFVFQNRGTHRGFSDPRKRLLQLRTLIGSDLTYHDLRRTFVTLAERLDISYFALKRLVNHSEANDVTAGYIISDVTRLREPMQRISDEIDRLARAADASGLDVRN